jgi:hypothetical protein
MLKPNSAAGRRSPLSESAYMSAMNYSGTWVVVAILSILLGIETFLTHLKVYIGIESVSTKPMYCDLGKKYKALLSYYAVVQLKTTHILTFEQ